MRHAILIAFCTVAFTTRAQLVFDAYYSPTTPGKYFVPNQGQFLDSDGELMPDVRYLSYGNTPWIAMEKDSRVSLAFDATLDTLQPQAGKIGWYPVGEMAALCEPVIYKAGAGVNNYLYPHVPNGIYGVVRRTGF